MVSLRLLVQQNEELRRKERTSSALSESYRTQVDVLQFQLGLNNENESEDGTMNDLNARGEMRRKDEIE